jgi:hypothetical protein
MLKDMLLENRFWGQGRRKGVLTVVDEFREELM